MTPPLEEQLLAAARARGFLSEQQAAEALATARAAGTPLLHLLAQRYLSPAQLSALRAAPASDSAGPTAPYAVDRGAGTVSIDAGGAAPALPASPGPGLRAGDRLGRYLLERELAQGGMGMVFVARDTQLDRQVALKVMLKSDPRAQARFLREAQATAKLTHPNVVAIHEAGEHQGRPFLVMDLIEGRSLRQWLDDAGHLGPREAAEVALGIARGIAAAHAVSVLHRDLKPDNVLIDGDGATRVTDFGLATFADSDSLTKTGQLLGTPAYMAPEQAKGDLERVGPRTDVYGIGATLYEALAGEPPFSGASAANLVVNIVAGKLKPPSHRRGERIDPTLEAICLRCLARDPDDRYPSAEALAADLERWLEGEPVALPRSHRAVWVGAGLAAVAVAVALGVASREPPAPTATAAPTPTSTQGATPAPSPTALTAAQARAWRRVEATRTIADPADRLAALRRWLGANRDHPRRTEARRLEARALLETPSRTLRHPNPACKGGQLFPGGERAVTHGGGLIVEWDLATGAERRRWTAPGSANHVAIHPQGTSFLTAGRGYVWIVPLEGEPRRFGRRRSTTMVAWSPTGRFFAVGGDDGRVRAFKRDKKRGGWRLHKIYEHHRSPVNALAFVTDALLVTGAGPSLDRNWAGKGIGSSECAIRIYDLLRFKKHPVQVIQLAGPPMCLAAGDAQTFYVGCENNRLLRYPVGGTLFKELISSDVPKAAHRGQIRGLSVRHGWVASGSGNDHLREHNELRIWSVARQLELARMLRRPFRLQTVELGPDRRVLIGGPGGAELWDLRALEAP